MKCDVNSNVTHAVMISKDSSFKSYKEICSGEKKKVNLGHWGDWDGFKVENNSMVLIPRKLEDNIYAVGSAMPYEWEVLSSFFSIHGIDQNWLHCNFTAGNYDEDLGGWTGCMGQV